MPRTPTETGRARPAPAPHGDAAPLPALRGTVGVPLTALATPDQITICTLYQWLHAVNGQLVPLPANPRALQQTIAAVLAQEHWATLFHAVQQLGSERPAPPLDAVLHTVRGTFTALTLAMELLVADAGSGDDGRMLLALVQAQRSTLHRLIPDLSCRPAVDVPCVADTGGILEA